MKFPTQASLKHLKALIATGYDNRGPHLVWLAKNGGVHLTSMDPEEPFVVTTEQVFMGQCVYAHEALARGGGWVGPEAAADPSWMAELHAQLTYQWKRYKSPPPEWPHGVRRRAPV
jgi:hypothetical protein